MKDRRSATHRYTRGEIQAPGRLGDATLMPTKIKSGLAASMSRGRVHLVAAAALVADDRGATLTARWLCGGGAVNAIPAADSEIDCDRCQYLEALGAPVLSPVVYRCYDADGALLYIGSSRKPAQRILGHRTNTDWWPDVAHVEFEEHVTEAAARLSESRAIRAERPRFNRDCNFAGDVA